MSSPGAQSAGAGARPPGRRARGGCGRGVCSAGRLVTGFVAGLLWLIGVGACQTAEPDPVLPGQRAGDSLFAPPLPQLGPERREAVLSDPQLAELDAQLSQTFARVERLADPEVEREQLVVLEQLAFAMGRPDDLLRAYRRQVEGAGPESRLAPRLAWIYFELGYLERSAALLAEVEAVQPDNPDVHVLRVLSRLRLGRQAALRDPAVIERLERVQAMEPDYVAFFPYGADWVDEQLASATELRLEGAGEDRADGSGDGPARE